MKKLYELTKCVVDHRDCMMQIYDGKIMLHTGAGKDRKSFSCGTNDKNGVVLMINHLKSLEPVRNIA